MKGPVLVGIALTVLVLAGCERGCGSRKPAEERPVGVLRGTVRFVGEAPPETRVSAPERCANAQSTFGKRFRVGPDGALADALVAVTDYEGKPADPGPTRKVTLQGCAPAKRTIDVTLGQRIELFNLDAAETYVPYLDGTPVKAMMVATPQGGSVKLHPPNVGRFALRDQTHPFLFADVFVLKYPTHDVTDVDGRYEIGAIPVGEVTVSVLLPATGQTLKQQIDIRPGVNTLDLTLERPTR